MARAPLQPAPPPNFEHRKQLEEKAAKREAARLRAEGGVQSQTKSRTKPPMPMPRVGVSSNSKGNSKEGVTREVSPEVLRGGAARVGDTSRGARVPGSHVRLRSAGQQRRPSGGSGASGSGTGSQALGSSDDPGATMRIDVPSPNGAGGGEDDITGW